MKNNWEIKKLGEVCIIKGRIGYRGYTKQDIVEKGNGAISLSPSNIKDNNAYFDKCTYVSWDKYNESPEIMIYPGDIVYCKTASIGKMALIESLPEKMTLNPQFVVLKEIKCLNKFLYYFMISKNFKSQIARIIGGTAIPTLSQENLGNLNIPIPLLATQKLIVSILDKSFEKISKAKENAEKNLKNSKALFESHLQSVFENKGEGWEEKTLGEVCEIDPKKSEIKGIARTEMVSFLPMRDLGILQKQTVPKETRKLSEVTGSYTYFAENDILLAKVTPCFENGKLGIAKNLKNGIGFGSSEYIVFRPLGKISSEYLFYLLSSNNFRNNGKKLMFGACGLKRLSKDYVQSALIPIPSIKEQKSIVSKLDALSAETKKLESIYQQKLNDLEELKKAILQKAFNGELTGD